MSEWSPKSLWDRVRRTVAGWMDEEAEVDAFALAFHLAFIVPLLIAWIALLRR